MENEVIHTYTKDILIPIIKRVKSYLEEEFNIDVFNTSEISCPKDIHLKKNTVMIGTSGSIKLIISLGFDEKLIDKIVDIFMGEDNISDFDLSEIKNSVICEVTNTIIANVIDNPVDESNIYITPPVLISEAKTLNKNKDSKFVFVTFITKYGEIELTAVGPKEQFEDILEFKV